MHKINPEIVVDSEENISQMIKRLRDIILSSNVFLQWSICMMK